MKLTGVCLKQKAWDKMYMSTLQSGLETETTEVILLLSEIKRDWENKFALLLTEAEPLPLCPTPL